MKTLLTLAIFMFATTAYGQSEWQLKLQKKTRQDPEKAEASAGQSFLVELDTDRVPNPFKEFSDAWTERYMEYFEEDRDASLLGAGYGDAAVLVQLAQPSFQDGLRQSIILLGQYEDEKKKSVMKQYIRDALGQRYDDMMASRRDDLETLKKGVAKLESELKRRESAKQRVVDLQIESAQLAAEGLLEIGELESPAMPGMGSMGSGGYEGAEDESGGGYGVSRTGMGSKR